MKGAECRGLAPFVVGFALIENGRRFATQFHRSESAARMIRVIFRCSAMIVLFGSASLTNRAFHLMTESVTGFVAFAVVELCRTAADITCKRFSFDKFSLLF